MRIPFIKYNHQKYLDELTKIQQTADNYQILDSSKAYQFALINYIRQAKKQIYMTALYIEQDEAGKAILHELYTAKKNNPDLDIKIFIDWHRAQRGRIGDDKSNTNALYYYQLKMQNPDVDIPIYGVPVNRRELLGVLHLKGYIFDDSIIYTGASINNVYLHQLDKYRYDRYHVIKNAQLAQSMIQYLNEEILPLNALQRLDVANHKTRKQIKADVRILRQHLSNSCYQFDATADNQSLSITPIVGLGKNNQLNRTIHHLINVTEQKAIFCTPYFNLPAIIVKDMLRLLRRGKQVEIIVGDKTANDFYIPEDEPFNIVGGLPYLYEVNLRKFVERLQHYVDNQQLIVRLWKDGDQTYHLKGVWIDDQWMLITGNNLNPRAWRLDLENGILVHDPKLELQDKIQHELALIREKTQLIEHFQQIQAQQFYPKPVHKLISRLSRIRIDRIIKRLL